MQARQDDVSARQERQGAKNAKTVLKDCYVSLLYKKAWRPWPLGELGGHKNVVLALFL
jgi:hypothetical protein